MIPDLTGKTAVITGATRGLGAVLARHFVDAGAHVILCGRDRDALIKVMAGLKQHAKPGQVVAGDALDIAHNVQVVTLVQRAMDETGAIDILVNNAGVIGPIGPLDSCDWDEWVETIAVNLLGAACLTRAVLPLMREQGHGRIIMLSGGGATSPLPNFSAYGASKAAIVRLAETLAVELAGSGITVNAIAPGAMDTAMTRASLDAGVEMAGADYHTKLTKMLADGGTDPALPARLALYLASDSAAGISGRLISAPWDPWPFADDQAGAIAASDIYTLRRIVPADRGHAWGDK